MQWWSTPHQALLNALEADAALPFLFSLLTDGTLKPQPSDIARLRDWPVALRESPCGPAFESWLNHASAAPLAHRPGFAAVWPDFAAAGFSDRAVHHQALLFVRLADRLLDARHFDLAERLTTLAAEAWNHLLRSDYLEELFRKLGGIEAGLHPRETLSHLLDADFDARLEDTRALLRTRGHDLDRDQLRFNARWFAIWATTQDDQQQTAFVSRRVQFETACSLQIAQDLDDRLTALELTRAQANDLTPVFSDARLRLEALDFPAAGVEEVVARAIDTLWTLRRLKRDDEPLFSQVVDEAMPLVPALERQIAAGTSVGQNARCADILVFRAERERGEKRRPFLERALNIAPKHRNASMLLSYLHLHDANLALVRAETAITVKAARKALSEAQNQIGRARTLFSENIDLPAYDERFLKACFKHGLQPHDFHDT